LTVLRIPLLEDLPVPTAKTVLVRVDFNVPLAAAANGARVVTDDFRIRAVLPTLNWLLDRGASITACTHLGRPKGKVDPRYDVSPLRAVLDDLGLPVALMENLRFDPGEEANDPAFVDRLVSGFDLYVNDAFGVCHRSHASVVGPPSRLPSAAGRLVEKEVEVLGHLVTEPKHPFVVILGGAKVSDKLGLVRSLAAHADYVLLGGGMACTFMAANGLEVGDSLVDASAGDDCRAILSDHAGKVLLPLDSKVLMPGNSVDVVKGSVPSAGRILDIGPDTCELFGQHIMEAETVFWNGPMGMFEDERFSTGTRSVAQSLAQCEGFTVVGGGDSVAALDAAGLSGNVGFLSTGGGAALELLEKGDLPGLAALRESMDKRAAGRGAPWEEEWGLA
jgi:phosphoglycerate kinase